MPAANPSPCFAMVTTACRLQTADCELQTADCRLHNFISLLVPFLCSLAFFWALFYALGLSFGGLGRSFGAFVPQVEKMKPREQIEEQFGVQIGPHFGPSFRYFFEKIGFGQCFCRVLFLNRFFLFFGRLRAARNHENRTKPF